MRRRADSPHGPMTQESPHPSKRIRRQSGSPSLSPSIAAEQPGPRYMSNAGPNATSPRIIRTSSPARNALPPLHPLPRGSGGQAGPGAYQSFSAAGREASSSQPPAAGSWAPNWPPGHLHRHSVDTPNVVMQPQVGSPSPERREDQRPTEGGNANSNPAGPDIVFTRDVTNRQPRSMMACMRCRRQKMKCDGPGKEPCRGCRQAGVPCVFESRARPKSISTLPTRGSPFYAGSLPPGRGLTPGAGPSFYPATAQAAPPVTSRPALAPDYALRQAREPMPPPANASISSLASVTAPYPPPLRQHTPPLHTPPSATGQPPGGYYPPPLPPGVGPPGPTYVQAPPQQHAVMSPQHDSRVDGRLRGLETAFRSVSTLPAAVAGIQATLGSLLRAQDALSSQLAGQGGSIAPAPPSVLSGALRDKLDVPEQIWESYRVGAWPLTPWLPGISPLPGLPALVLLCLGRRAAVERSDAIRRESEAAAEAVFAELSRLLASRVPWTRDEVLSLGVYATWTSDPALGCLSVGLARDLQLDRPHTLRKSHDEWREWIYVVLADHMLHLPDFSVPIVHEPLAAHWRELVSASSPADPSTLDRDSKLLAWLDYSELLIEVQAVQRASKLPGSPSLPEGRRDSGNDRSDPSRPSTGSSAAIVEPVQQERDRARDIWRRFASKWEAWAGSSHARHDPVMLLHFHYAILYTASPVFAASDRVWGALSQSHEGYQQLERGRDAAFAVLACLATPEIARTLAYSFPVTRPFFGLAIAHLISLAATLSHTPIISLPHVQDVLRSVVDTLGQAPDPVDQPAGRQPTDGPGAGRAYLPASLLLEMADSGAIVAIGKRDIVGAEPGRDLWRRIVG